MFSTLVSRSNTISLNEVLGRLAERPAVDGVVLFGSASGAMTETSDYDLLVVLSEMPAPLHVALSYIDRRLADIIFVSSAAIDHLLLDPGSPIPNAGPQAALVRWLRAGHIVFDRTGRLRRAQVEVQAVNPIVMEGDGALRPAWFAINYNLRQTRRLLQSDDPVVQTTVDLRLLFSIHEVWVSYFRLRRLPWRGDKEGIRYVADHDPTYLELLRRCLGETDRESKVQLYERLAEMTLAPFGGLWPPEATAIQFEGGTDVDPNMVGAALAFWESLVGKERHGEDERGAAHAAPGDDR